MKQAEELGLKIEIEYHERKTIIIGTTFPHIIQQQPSVTVSLCRVTEY